MLKTDLYSAIKSEDSEALESAQLSNPVKYQYVTSASVYSKYAKVSKLAIHDISSQ